MADKSYKIVEVVGTSSEGVDDAIRGGIASAGESLRNLDWFEATQIRGYLEDDGVHWFQVTLKIGFRLER